MTGDFPAAHSMDTTWFAVDKCGHVAVFESGEDGSVPEGAPDAYVSLAADQPIAGELDRCLQRGALVPGRHISEMEHPMDLKIRLLRKKGKEAAFARGFFLLGPGLKSRGDILRKPDIQDPAYRWIQEPVFGSTDGRDWVEGVLCEASWIWLHEVPHRCLGCVRNLNIEFDKRIETCAMIRYECQEYGNQPYERTDLPTVPTTLEELQKKMSRPLPAAPRFGQLCFREKRMIQPIQWMPSRTYTSEGGWTDEDGRQHEKLPKA